MQLKKEGDLLGRKYKLTKNRHSERGWYQPYPISSYDDVNAGRESRLKSLSELGAFIINNNGHRYQPYATFLYILRLLKKVTLII
jgi:hypothetical protein